MKRVFAIVLIVCLLVCAAACTPKTDGDNAAVYEEEYKLTDGKKAIIIIPGLLASGLYDKETEEALWDPIKSDEVDLLEFMGVYDETHVNITIDTLLEEWLDLFDYAADVIGDTDKSIMRRIMCDDQGDPAPNVVGVPVTYEGHLKYGALNSYKWWADGLKAEFGDEYEVVVFNYNWLTDTRYAVRDFAQFMKDNNYTESILIGHSMGGLVATEYLALGAESRARVDKFIAMAVPFYGSYMASSTFENPYVFQDMIDYYMDMFMESDFVQSNAILSKLDLTATKAQIMEMYNNMIVPFLFNLKSVYQLLPSAELLELQASIAGQGAYENGQKIAAEDLFAWYKTRPFTTTNGLATKEEAASLATRAIFADWQAYRDGFYVDKPEGKVFACDLVDTYYVAGNDSATETAIVVEGEKRYSTTSLFGDSVVPLLSATRGKAADNRHVFLVSGEEHIPMGTHWEGSDQKDIVLKIISGN